MAFVVLIVLLLFFSIFAPNFAAWNNMVNIMQATAVNGVLGVAVTFVIMVPTESSISLLIPGLEIPNGVLIMFAVAVVASIVLNRTIIGRMIFVLGSNEEAARLSGITVERWKILTYAISGAICGVAGLLVSSRRNPRSGLATSLTLSPPRSMTRPRPPASAGATAS